MLTQKHHRSPIYALDDPTLFNAGTASPLSGATMATRTTSPLQHSMYVQPITTTEPLVPLWSELCYAVKHKNTFQSFSFRQIEQKRSAANETATALLQRSVANKSSISLYSSIIHARNRAKPYSHPFDRLSPSPHHTTNHTRLLPPKLPQTACFHPTFIFPLHSSTLNQKKSCGGVVAITS